MKIIGHLLAVLLATVLSLAISSWIFEQTLWSAPYLAHQADQTKLYSNLAGALPKAFAAADPNVAQNGLNPLDPELIQSQIAGLLPQFIDHLHKGGPAPTIDLTAFAAAIGQPPPEGDTIQPLTLGSADTTIAETGKKLHTAGQYAPLAAIALILLIIGIMRARRFPTLSRAGLETAVALALGAGLLWLAPGFLSQALSKPTLTPIRDAVSPFISSVCHAIAGQFIIAALIFLVLAVGLSLVHGTNQLLARFRPKPKNPPTAAPPATANRF